ncbi:MAG: hypothetical protein HY314_10600, partial [Acidobacteria bacterium]|nr:hypothetical protein [Acidobacteriota bacterium]
LGSWVLMAQFVPVQGSQSTAVSPPLVEILSDPQFYEEVANPRLTSRNEVEERVTEYEELLEEINALKASPRLERDGELKAKAEQAARLLARFLDFARDTPGRNLVYAGDELVIQVPLDLDQNSRQQAVERIQVAHARMLKKWRAHIKLGLPPGFIFVKLYESRERMAGDYKLGPETAGVAFPCRYIAVALPSQESAFWGRMKQYFIGEEFQQTVAHEFVHSSCFMTLGYQRAGELPRWFMEGFALHFSGERHVRTAIEGPGGLTIRDFDSTEEYRDFKRLFQFVLEKYGPDRLYDFARRSLEQGSVHQSLPQVLNLANEPALIGTSVSWRRDKERFQWRWILMAACLVTVVFVVFRGRWAGLRWVTAFFIIWAAMARAALSPYYIHTLLWWVPAMFSLPLVYLILRAVRQPRAPEPTRIRLVVASDWPRLDEVMDPWPYEQVNLAEIIQAGLEEGWGWGEREIIGSEAQRLKAFLDSQSTDFFYFQGHAYRVWYEGLGTITTGNKSEAAAQPDG